MDILLVYLTSGITSAKKSRDLKVAAILKILKYETQLHFGLIYEKIVPNCVKKYFSWWWRHRWRHRVGSNSGASGKDNVSSIHANIIMVFLGYTWLNKISINNTFPRSRVKGQRHRLTGWPWHLNGRNSVNLGIIKMKQRNARNSHSYVASATKIQFYFQFPRLPYAAFGGGWLLNWKFKFGRRIISNIAANHVKCNYFLDNDGIDNVTLRQNSQIFS